MPQLVRYALVGVVSNSVIYLLYLLITYIHVEPKLAMSIVYFFGTIVGFLGNQKWTFSQQKRDYRVALKYLVAQIIGYLFNFLILVVFVDTFGFSHRLVQAIAIFVVAAFLFATLKYVVFYNAVALKK